MAVVHVFGELGGGTGVSLPVCFPLLVMPANVDLVSGSMKSDRGHSS